mmetsp:Transcript_27350/g.40448  ORF Transcript_27350/g.40448 Transcript_27350/m.40448 type:complete len:113 (+) Transcript_27350:174-512(+)
MLEQGTPAFSYAGFCKDTIRGRTLQNPKSDVQAENKNSVIYYESNSSNQTDSFVVGLVVADSGFEWSLGRILHFPFAFDSSWQCDPYSIHFAVAEQTARDSSHNFAAASSSC